MTIDHIVPFLIVAVIVISSLASGARAVKKGFDGVVGKQRAAEPERIAAIQAQLAQRGVKAPAALQGLLAALQSAAESSSAPAQQPQGAYVAQPAYAAQPAYSAPPQQQQNAGHQKRQKHQQQPELTRAPAFVARSLDVPVFAVQAPAPTGTLRRT
ncbi:MAG: hypothetical protein QOD51_602, partial [Candidatus Eremiobacteraeota bacterium]|nr:hypothetical protein [Candidatus Eremiobacteraeota bacterium]